MEAITMSAIYNPSCGQLSIYTSIGDFHAERGRDELYDTWTGDENYDVNVWCEDDEADNPVFIATLYPVICGVVQTQDQLAICFVELAKAEAVQ